MNSRIHEFVNSDKVEELQRLRHGFDRADSLAELIRWRVRLSTAARDALFDRAITVEEWQEIVEHITASSNDRTADWIAEPPSVGRD